MTRTPLQLVFPLVLTAALALPLAGCGKKPGGLLPPPGAEDNSYPRTYPDPATPDPAPKTDEEPQP